MITADSKNLDLLRAVAVVSVLLSHLLFNVFRIEHVGIFSAHEIGRMGVLIFFVHTALVLMMSLERTRTERPYRDFYIRRACRIYPLSIACIVFVMLLRIPPMPDEAYVPVTFAEGLSNVLLLQNVTGARSLTGVLWSLPYEVQMYLVLPALFFFIRRRSISFLAALWAGCVAVQGIAVIPALRPIYDLIRFVPWFLGGVFVYRCSRTAQTRLPGWMWPTALAGVFAIHALLWSGEHKSARRNLSEYFVCAVLCVLLPRFEDLTISAATRAAHIVAKYSYGVYLFHPLVLWFSFVQLSGKMQWPCFVALMVLIPLLCYRLIEAPMMAFGRRITEQLDRSHAHSNGVLAVE